MYSLLTQVDLSNRPIDAFDYKRRETEGNEKSSKYKRIKSLLENEPGKSGKNEGTEWEKELYNYLDNSDSIAYKDIIVQATANLLGKSS